VSHRGVSYSQVLNEFRIASTFRGVWASVGNATQLQGWKLHLSSIPTEAVTLLSCVLPLLSQRGVSFKIAKDAWTLSQLNEGDLGATQVGKFMTLYPRSDEEAIELADELSALTKGFHGPVIVSDLRLGDIIYTRYGGFNPIITRDRLGQMFLSIYAPDGTLRIDLQQVPFSPPDGVPNPFTSYLSSNRRSSVQDGLTAPVAGVPSTPSKLFGPGYLVVEVIKHQPKGSIFRAIDLRGDVQVGLRVLKQGRQYCLADEHGRDIRTRLRHQEALHNTLAGRVAIAAADRYFEVEGDGYLPLQDIPGKSIESFTLDIMKDRSFGSLASADRLTLLVYLERLVATIQKMHRAGYVHRDLSASNIWIGEDERVYLLDLELAHRVNDATPAFGLGTSGFMSPAQEAGEPPTYADDIYALGCVMILLLTGLDPRRVLFASERDRVRQLSELTNGAPLGLIEKIAQCTNADPSARPSLASVKAMTRQYIEAGGTDNIPGFADNAEPFVRNSRHAAKPLAYEKLIRGAQQGLLDSVIKDEVSGLWLSVESPDSRVGPGSFYLRRDAHKGVAGVVYLLGRLARFGYGTEAERDRVQQAVRWLLTSEDSQNAPLPGLYFGEAGVAVAIVEAIAGHLIDRSPQINAFLSTALSGELDWPDITHGAAGQGVAAIYCADRIQDVSLLGLSHRCANYLIESQKPDGSWEMPAGVDGMSGETLTGFAHGVSGIVYFLSEYARRVGSVEASRSWEAGAAWLIDQAISNEDGQALEWYYSNAHRDRWKWWCHGSPGIALTFLRLYEHTRNGVYAEVAMKALRAHPLEVRYPNLSQCHGLSGLGEIYLEAGRVLCDRQWTERAEVIVKILCHLGRETDGGSVSWLVENADVATADLMVGSSGPTHFLLRKAMSAERLGFPLLLDPCSY
jgi:serine/threonine protein kinase